MSIADKIWDALGQVIKMNEQVVRLSVQVKDLAAEMRDKAFPLNVTAGTRYPEKQLAGLGI